MGRIVVESRGRIVIPAEVREMLNIREGSELEVEVVEGKIVLTPVRILSARDLYGIAGKELVDLEEIEQALGEES